MTLRCKDDNGRFTTVPAWNLYLINNVEANGVLLNWKVLNSDSSNIFSCSKNASVNFEISVFKIRKMDFHTWWENTFKFWGYIANWTFFHGGSFEITLTVPLNASLICMNICISELLSVPKTLTETFFCKLLQLLFKV